MSNCLEYKRLIFFPSNTLDNIFFLNSIIWHVNYALNYVFLWELCKKCYNLIESDDGSNMNDEIKKLLENINILGQSINKPTTNSQVQEKMNFTLADSSSFFREK